MRKYYPALLFTLLFCQHLFAQVPTISSFSPSSGPIGTSVTINGTNFSSTPKNNIVFFGSVRAIVNTASTGSLTIKVPAGATFQPITVTVNGLIAYSAKPFVVTFAGTGFNLTPDSFDPVVNYYSGSGTSCIAAADFDLDGKADIITAGINNSLSVFQNISDTNISLASQKYIGPGNKPYCLITGDLDGDGKQDIVMVNGGNNTISLFRDTSTIDTITGTRKILFAAKIDLSTGQFPYAATIRDFDGDGKADIAVVNSQDNSVSIFKNNSTIGVFSFALKTDFVTGASPYWIDAGDFDGDGKPDIATANGVASNSVSVLRNTSTGATISFTSKMDFDGGNLAYGISIADINNDNKQDLVVANGAITAASVLLNNSSGNISFAPKQALSNGYFAYSAMPSDMDGDGKLDIVVGNENQSSVSVFKNKISNDTFSFDAPISYQAHYGPWGVLLVDLDNDGKPDIATANETFGYISVLKNRANSPKINSITPPAGGNGAVVKINGINFKEVSNVYFGNIPVKSFTVISPVQIDAVVDSGASGRVKIISPYGADSLNGFSFTASPTIISFTPSSGDVGTVVNISGTNLHTVTAVKFGNLPASSFTVNSPTSITAVIGFIDSTLMEISVINPGGSYSAKGFYTGPTISSFFPKSGRIGSIVKINGHRFNNNILRNKVFFGGVSAKIIEASTNELKVIVPAYSTFDPISVWTDSLIAYSKEPFIVTFLAGDSGLTSNSLVIKGDSSTGRSPMAVSNADFDGDGKTDIVVANSLASGSVSILKNNSGPGYISFNYKVDFPTIKLPSKVVTGDIDGDGKQDIVLLNNQSNSVSVLKNTTVNGILSFAPEVEFTTGNSPVDISIRDMDVDGKPDLVILNESDNAVSVLRNKSLHNISFEPKVDFFALTYLASNNLTVGDVDNDGKPDILVAGDFNGAFITLKNKTIAGETFSSFSFERSNSFKTSDNPRSIIVADFDGDDKLDVAVGAANSAFISTHKNTSVNPVISFSDKSEYYFGNNNSTSMQTFISPADMNGDGIVDLVFTNHGYYSILKNAITSGSTQQIDNYGGPGINSMGQYIVADLDGDGKPDLASQNRESDRLYFYRNTAGEFYSMCIGENAILKANLSGINYKWQVNTGTGFNDIVDNDVYMNSTSELLDLRHVPSSLYGNQFRCNVDGNMGEIVTLIFANYWTGAVDTDWNNPSNWTCSRIPDSNTDVIINSGTLVINTNVTIRSLKINPGANVTVNPGVEMVVLH